jgi:hypothetical protein
LNNSGGGQKLPVHETTPGADFPICERSGVMQELFRYACQERESCGKVKASTLATIPNALYSCLPNTKFR